MKIVLIFLSMLVATGTILAQEAPEGLFINSKAPDFKTKDQSGHELRLKELLKKGPVVLVFFRGYWSPFCNRQLKNLEDSLSLIKSKGATLLAVSPENPESISKTVEKTKVTDFSLVYDEDVKIMKAYEVDFEVPDNTVTQYRNSGIDLQKINDPRNWNYLPVPAVYVIDKESTIVYRFFDLDYKKRPSVAEIVKNIPTAR